MSVVVIMFDFYRSQIIDRHLMYQLLQQNQN